MHKVSWGSLALATALLAARTSNTHATSSGRDQVVFDFESGNYDGWRRMGDAFGEVVATGASPHQLPVSGFCGRFLVGDADDDHLVVRLEFDGRVEFEATGTNSELMRPVCWDLSAFRGRQASSRIHLATSKDLETWKRDSRNPIVIDG